MANVSPVVLVALGAGAYLLLTEDGRALLGDLAPGPRRAPPSPAPPAPTVATSDPISAAIATAGGLVNAVMPELQDRDSDVRRGLRQFDRSARRVGSVLTGGLISDPKKDEKRKKRDAALAAGRLIEMETFAAKVHGAASRSDVREWVIDTPQTGERTPDSHGVRGVPYAAARISIYFHGHERPTEYFVPREHAYHQLAWIAEPIVRATGGFVQRGGRLAGGAPFVFYTDPETGVRVHAFSDANPYATRDQTAGQLFAVKNTPEAKAREISRVRRALPTSAYRAAYDAQQLQL